MKLVTHQTGPEGRIVQRLLIEETLPIERELYLGIVLDRAQGDVSDVSIAPDDRKYGHALIGGQGGGKSSVMARHFANDVRDPERAVILIDPKGPLAELCLGLVASGRVVHYMDLGHPEVGFNPLRIRASWGVRAAVFLQALIEASPAGSIQAASDSFLRQAVAAVCAVERQPTLWHVRDDGWMSASFNQRTAYELKKGSPLVLRYLLHAHRGDRIVSAANDTLNRFASSARFEVVPRPAPYRHMLQRAV